VTASVIRAASRSPSFRGKPEALTPESRNWFASWDLRITVTLQKIHYAVASDDGNTVTQG